MDLGWVYSYLCGADHGLSPNVWKSKYFVLDYLGSFLFLILWTDLP